MTESEVEAINAEASVLMKRGIELMNEPGREAPIDALHCFDEALELRRKVPADHSPFQSYLLAACLLNRADALVRLNDAAPLAAAIAAYGEGIEVLRPLPMAEDPRYPRRLAIAYQNQALALQTQGDADAAVTAYEHALAVLNHDDAAAVEDRDQVRAVVWLNLASVRAADPAPEAQAASVAAARQTLAYLAPFEADNMQAAAAALGARHVLCRVYSNRLSAADEGEPMPDDVHDATDAVDAALALVRAWEQRGVDVFRGFAFDLFRFGARVYARYQPQFLDEFIAENIDPEQSSPAYVESPDMVMAADEARQLIGSR